MTLLDAIYINYLEEIQKAKKAEPNISENGAKSVAWDTTTVAIESCLNGGKEHGFKVFTRNGQCRAKIEELSGSIENFRIRFVKEYIDKIFNSTQSKFIANKQMLLDDAIRNTGNPTKAYNALMDIIEANDYRRLLTGQNSTEQVESLKRNVGTRELAEIALSSVIQEKEMETAKMAEAHEKRHNGLITNLRINNPFTRRLAVIAATDKSWKVNKIRQQSINIGNDLYAATDIGNVRENQEDSVLIMYHPKNPDFKMLIVSDGVGGADGGELASSFVVETMKEWFAKLHPDWYKARHINNLKNEFEKAITATSTSLHNRNERTGGEGYATFCGAIVSERDTIISNVGDSRAYVYTNGDVKQLTEDDSQVWQQFRPRTKEEKDDLRFRIGSNVITQSMGDYSRVTPRSTIIPNSSYDCLMLFSDGVTDCLDDYQLKVITENTPRDKLAKMFVEQAKNNNSTPKRTLGPNYRSLIRGGKDNTTAAVYIPDER